jgi:hypothetical protein
MDSEALFKARMDALNLPAAVQAAMVRLGYDTHAAYAYSSSYVPGQSDEAPFKAVLQALLGDGYATAPEAPRLRRLFFESHTMAVMELRKKVERTDDDAPTRLPVEERSVRLARMKDRLPGLYITGVLEPSHRLVDYLAHQYETGQLRYVEWSACTMREQEVQGEKKADLHHSDRLAEDKDGYIRRTKETPQYTADVGSDLLLMQALQRRCIAYELANLADYDVMYALVQKMFRELQKPPISEAYQRVTYAQLEQADRQSFSFMAQQTEKGLQRTAEGYRPLEVSAKAALNDLEFGYILMQRPRAKAGSKDEGPHAEPKQDKSKADGPKGKGKGKQDPHPGKVKKEALKKTKTKTVARTADGEPICFAFQKHKCDKAKPGEKCSRGWHVCWMRDCQEAHAGKDHAK